MNMDHAAVRRLQVLLGLRAIDGMMSTATIRALCAAQSAAGIVPSGICTPETWDALEGVVAPAVGQKNAQRKQRAKPAAVSA
jgi:hypothetical protein